MMVVDKRGAEPEIVQNDRTNPPSTSIPIDEILGNYCTNYSQLVKEVSPQLVRHVCTIYSRSDKAAQVIAWVLQNRVFLVPTMRLELGLKKRTIYDILDSLHPWIKKTAIKVPHPNPSTRGPHPYVWIIDGEDVEEGVTEARKRFNETQMQHDPELQHRETLFSISAKIAHQLIKEGTIHGDPDQILRICENIPTTQLHPSERSTVVRQVYKELRKHREASP